MPSGEFDLIARYFAPLAGSAGLGLLDDAAVLATETEAETGPETGQETGQDLVLSKDMLAAGVHFFADDPPALIARKALRVNLSDLAAMGAIPKGYLLGLALPSAAEEYRTKVWLEAFARGLGEDQKTYGFALLGGDTVATAGPLTLSITALGTIKSGRALRRTGARLGDDIYVSGCLGDAALGLLVRQGKIAGDYPALLNRYHLPQPRLALGQALPGVASAVLDLSDGLAGDIRHIMALSGLGAAIEATALPVSLEAGKILERFPRYKSLIWQGGDDYELLFTAPVDRRSVLDNLSRRLALPLTRIGRMTAHKAVVIVDDKGRDLLQDGEGFRHF